jgi:multidrug resistance efflux pump
VFLRGEVTGEQNKQRRFYRCLRRKQNDHYAESVPCKHKASYTAHRLEGAIWHWIDTTVLNEENLRQRLEEQADVIAERRKPLEEELAGYERQLVRLQAHVDRLAELYAAGLYQLDDIAPKKQFLDTARESCKGEIARVKQLLAGMHTAHDRGEHAITLMRQIRANLAAGLTPDDQRKIIDLLDVRAVVGAEGGEPYADVTCQLTLDEARLILAGFVSNAACPDDNRA